MIPRVNEIHHKCGLASIISSQEECELIAAIFWFTFEVGLCMDENDGSRRLLGGALMSGLKDSEMAMDPQTLVEPLKEFE